jgi:nucleotide-binding universal stress UspA family protein
MATVVPAAAPPIVVAVDAADSAHDVVDWAAAEAAAQGSPLRVVHVIAPAFCLDPYMAGAMMESADATRAVGKQLLDQAVTRASLVAPELDVSTAMVDGTVAWALRREARAARLLVVGHHHHGQHGGLRALLAGSVSGELAVHAPCPVVVLRRLDDPVVGAARVVVGVNRGRSSSAALGFAFRAARQRGIPLTLLHVGPAVADQEGAEAVVDLPTFIEAVEDQAITQAITRWQDEFPDVPVRPALRGGEPTSALIAESTGAALLVVGSNGRSHRIGRLLGSIGQVALDQAKCPLAIVRQDHATDAHTDNKRWLEVHSASL